MTTLVDAMQDYLDAGVTMDLARLDAVYDDEFENLRIDQAGQVVRITKPQLMARFGQLAAQGLTMEPADDASFPTTTVVGDTGIVVMRRVKDGRPVLYAFVWRMRDDRPTTMLRELTFEEDLTALVRMIEEATRAAGATA
ncbi:hypothetical protein [Cellulomonas sp. HZM]|uniref:hypothetical protein n=1 Tax=Cellulomonas sp. HZM TaxID=1454010 RepID=UPI000493B297|nr:hypothetical protein [Cellulomonas sp. HZM]